MKKEAIIKGVAVLLLAVLVVITSPKKQTEGVGKSDKGTISIGILQILDHPSLDAARKGFIDKLAEKGYKDEENINITYLNAQGDQSNLKVMSQKLVSQESDLLLGIATPSAQALANETKDIPVLTTAVTDLVDAKLVKSNEKPNTNVSGTSDMTPIKEQLELLKTLVPTAKVVGLLYNSSEPNSKLQVDIADEEAKKLGYTTTTMTVTNTNDVAQNMQTLAKKVDAIYIPTDNTLASAMATVGKIAKEYKVPVIAGAQEMVEAGGLATVGIDYYKLGQQTAEMAIKIFEDKAKVAEMPVETQGSPQVIVNEDMAKALNINIPEGLKGEK